MAANSFYADNCTGLFGGSSTHVVMLFTIFITIYNLECGVNRFRGGWKKKIFCAYVFGTLGLMLLFSTLNDNTAMFIFVPIFLIWYYLHVINNKPNGTNINNNAGSTHIEGLQKFVVEKGLDVGFAFDGDADRCLCVDEKGNVITGDHILYIYGCYMKERGKLLTNTVVTTVMSNFGLYKAFDEQGIGYAKTAVGDKYVYEYMAKNGCRIGGEQSGHIIFSKYASTGDGILTSLKMMEVMLAKKKPMSELAAPLKIYPQVLENIRVTDKKAAQNDPAVQEAVSKVAEALGDTGRILVRESGTEPVVRVMVEAPDHDTCQKYVDEVVNVICEKGYKA